MRNLLILLVGLAPFSLGWAEETVKTAQPAGTNSVVWPTKMTDKVYVVPVTIDPAAIADAKKKNEEGISILPPDEEESKQKLADLKKDLTAAIIEKLSDADLPISPWTGSGPVPSNGWKLEGNVVNLDPGKKMIGTDNPVVGIVVSITDASVPTNQPFLVLNCSAKAKVSPGPGISPFAKIGNAIAKGTGLQETMQIGRLADSISENFTQALKKNKLLKDD